MSSGKLNKKSLYQEGGAISKDSINPVVEELSQMVRSRIEAGESPEEVLYTLIKEQLPADQLALAFESVGYDSSTFGDLMQTVQSTLDQETMQAQEAMQGQVDPELVQQLDIAGQQYGEPEQPMMAYGGVADYWGSPSQLHAPGVPMMMYPKTNLGHLANFASVAIDGINEGRNLRLNKNQIQKDYKDKLKEINAVGFDYMVDYKGQNPEDYAATYQTLYDASNPKTQFYIPGSRKAPDWLYKGPNTISINNNNIPTPLPTIEEYNKKLEESKNKSVKNTDTKPADFNAPVERSILEVDNASNQGGPRNRPSFKEWYIQNAVNLQGKSQMEAMDIYNNTEFRYGGSTLPKAQKGRFLKGLMAPFKSSVPMTTITHPYSVPLAKPLYAPEKIYGRMFTENAEMLTRGDLVKQYNARNNAYHTVNITDDIRNNEELRHAASVYGFNPNSDKDLALFLGTSPGGSGRRTGYEDVIPEGYDILYSGNNPFQTLHRYGNFAEGTPFTTKFRLFNDNTSMLSDEQLFDRIGALDGYYTNRPDLRIRPFREGDDISTMLQGQIINTNSLSVPGLNQTNLMLGRTNVPVREAVDIRSGEQMNAWNPGAYPFGSGLQPSDYDFLFRKYGGSNTLPSYQNLGETPSSGGGSGMGSAYFEDLAIQDLQAELGTGCDCGDGSYSNDCCDDVAGDATTETVQGNPEVTRGDSAGNFISRGINKAENFLKNNYTMKRIGTAANNAVNLAAVANQYGRDRKAKEAYRENRYFGSIADNVYMPVNNPMNKRGTFDLNTGLAEPDNLVDYYGQAQRGKELTKEEKEYYDFKTYLEGARQAYGTQQNLDKYRLDGSYNSNDLISDYLEAQRLRKAAGLGMGEEADLVFPHVGQMIRGTFNDWFGTHYKKGGEFKPHMMYDPKSGKAYKANKPEDHERMAKMGYTHELPKAQWGGFDDLFNAVYDATDSGLRSIGNTLNSWGGGDPNYWDDRNRTFASETERVVDENFGDWILGREGYIPDALTFGKPTGRQLETAGAILTSPKNWVVSENDIEPLPNYNEYNSFNEAFAKARKDLGRGQSFLYGGKRYTTNYKDEAPNNETEEILKYVTKDLSPEEAKRYREVWQNAGQPPIAYGPDDEKYSFGAFDAGWLDVASSGDRRRPHVNLLNRDNKIWLNAQSTPDSVRDLLLEELGHVYQVRRDGTFNSFGGLATGALKEKVNQFGYDPYHDLDAFEGEAHEVIEPILSDYVYKGGNFPVFEPYNPQAFPNKTYKYGAELPKAMFGMPKVGLPGMNMMSWVPTGAGGNINKSIQRVKEDPVSFAQFMNGDMSQAGKFIRFSEQGGELEVDNDTLAALIAAGADIEML